MGYVADTYTLIPAGTVCAAGVPTPPAANNVAGPNFVRGLLRVSITAQSGTWTTTGAVQVWLQNSPDGGTTWYPNAAALAAAGYATSNVPEYARPPYGYRLGDAGPHPNKAHAAWGRRAHKLEPDPDTAPVVTWMFA
jgi:hypothetical protein